MKTSGRARCRGFAPFGCLEGAIVIMVLAVSVGIFVPAYSGARRVDHGVGFASVFAFGFTLAVWGSWFAVASAVARLLKATVRRSGEMSDVFLTVFFGLVVVFTVAGAGGLWKDLAEWVLRLL